MRIRISKSAGKQILHICQIKICGARIVKRHIVPDGTVLYIVILVVQAAILNTHIRFIAIDVVIITGVKYTLLQANLRGNGHIMGHGTLGTEHIEAVDQRSGCIFIGILLPRDFGREIQLHIDICRAGERDGEIVSPLDILLVSGFRLVNAPAVPVGHLIVVHIGDADIVLAPAVGTITEGKCVVHILAGNRHWQLFPILIGGAAQHQPVNDLLPFADMRIAVSCASIPNRVNDDLVKVKGCAGPAGNGRIQPVRLMIVQPGFVAQRIRQCACIRADIGTIGDGIVTVFGVIRKVPLDYGIQPGLGLRDHHRIRQLAFTGPDIVICARFVEYVILHAVIRNRLHPLRPRFAAVFRDRCQQCLRAAHVVNQWKRVILSLAFVGHIQCIIQNISPLNRCFVIDRLTVL